MKYIGKKLKDDKEFMKEVNELKKEDNNSICQLSLRF